MRLKVKVKAKAVWNEQRRQRVAELAAKAADRLGVTRGSLTIKLKGPMQNGDLGYAVEQRVGKWMIVLAADELYESTLVHEMVHVKQYFRRELEMFDRTARWKREIWSLENYADQPWEIEAFAVEEALAKEWNLVVDRNF